jgi:hypothetical protein
MVQVVCSVLIVAHQQSTYHSEVLVGILPALALAVLSCYLLCQYRWITLAV